jgi:hypothetical protein
LQMRPRSFVIGSRNSRAKKSHNFHLPHFVPPPSLLYLPPPRRPAPADPRALEGFEVAAYIVPVRVSGLPQQTKLSLITLRLLPLRGRKRSRVRGPASGQSGLSVNLLRLQSRLLRDALRSRGVERTAPACPAGGRRGRRRWQVPR